MGLEMIGLLVHKPTLSLLLEQSWSDLKEGMGGGAFRHLRPEQDAVLTTMFAIDA